MNNTLLNIALVIGRIIQVVLVLLSIGNMILGVVVLFLPEYFGYFEFEGEKLRVDTINLTDGGFIPKTGIALFIILKKLISCIAYYLIVREIVRIIQSIRSLSTFKEQNTIGFRKAGTYFLVLFLISIYSIYEIPGEGFPRTIVEFSIDLEYIIPAIICLILAEVFKEGNKLREENQLTI